MIHILQKPLLPSLLALIYPSKLRPSPFKVNASAWRRKRRGYPVQAGLIVVVALMSLSTIGFGQNKAFVDVTTQMFTDLPQVNNDGRLAWGDYDNDNRLDLIITGYTSAERNPNISRLYHNTASGFVDQSSLPQVSFGSVHWADYAKNGQLGLMITGNGPIVSFFEKLYYNTPSGFTDESSLISVINTNYDTFLAWGDYNNDGLLDLMVTGAGDYSSVHYTRLYHNTGNGFVEQNSLFPNLPPLVNGSSAWGDYDNNGTLDLIISGYDKAGTTYTKLYHNTGNGFTDESRLIRGVTGSPTWVDYDNDGRLDLFTSGFAFHLYRNTPGGFVNQSHFISGPELAAGSSA